MGILRAALADEWDGLERISRDIRPADIATLANAIMGLLAINLAASGRTELGALLILVGILLDGVDGALARLFGGGPLGGFLDTLSDVITFAVAPAVLLVQTPELGWATGVVASLYLVAVILRLARFEALRERKDRRYFSGLSSPGGALVVVATILVGLPAAATWAVALAVAGLMVSRVRYPKLRGWLGVLAAAVIVAVLAVAWLPLTQTDLAVWAMMAFMAFYLVAGPFYVLLRIGPTQHPEAR